MKLANNLKTLFFSSILLIAFALYSTQVFSAYTGSSKEDLKEFIAETWSLKYAEPDSFFINSERIITEGKKMNFSYAIAYGYTYKGISYYLSDRYDSAQFYFDKAFYEFSEMDDKNGLAKVHNYKGLCYDALDSYDKALEEYSKSLELKQELKDDLAVANTLNNIGALYISQEKFDKALECLEKAQTLYLHQSNLKGQALVLNNLGLIHDKNHEFDLAIDYYIGSLKIEEKLAEDSAGIALSYNNIGSLYSDNMRIDEALFYFNKALEIYTSLELSSGLMLVRNNISEAFRKDGRIKESVDQAKLALNLADSVGALDDIQIAHHNLALSYKTMGDYEKALNHFETYTELNDSLQSTFFKTELAETEANLSMINNYNILKEEHYKLINYGSQKTFRQIMLIIGVLSVLIVFGVHGNWIKLNSKLVDFLLIIGVMCLYEGIIQIHNELFEPVSTMNLLLRYGGHFLLFVFAVGLIKYGRDIAKNEE